jgi:hypothetical protein
MCSTMLSPAASTGQPSLYHSIQQPYLPTDDLARPGSTPESISPAVQNHTISIGNGNGDENIKGSGSGEDQSGYASLGSFELGADLDFLSQWSRSDFQFGEDDGSSPSTSVFVSTSATTASETHTQHGHELNLPDPDHGNELALSEPGHEHELHPPDNQVHDCEAEAFTILRSLHCNTMIFSDPGMPATATAGCSRLSTPQSASSQSHAPNRMPPLDKVLLFNRVAISKLKELLRCRCAHQPHLALQYIAIISKTLFWYRLVVSPQYEALSAANGAHMSGSPRSRNGPCNDSRNSQGPKARTIQIGVFDLEEEDEKLLMRTVLLREVKKVEAVIEAMKAMTVARPRDEYGDEVGEQHMASWYAVGGARLDKERYDTLKQVKEMGTSQEAASVQRWR